MLKGFLKKIAVMPFRHNRVVLIAIVLVTALALVQVADLKFELDQSKSFPQDLASARDYNKYSEIFGSSNYLLVTVETIDKELVTRYDKFIEELIAALTKSPLIKKARSALPEDQTQELKRFTMRHLFLHLTPEDRSRVALRYSPNGIRDSLSQTRSKKGGIFYRSLSLNPLDLLLDPFSTFDAARDPLGINSLAAKYFKPPGLKFKKRLDDNFYFSTDGQLAFFLVEPVEPYWNIAANEPLVREVQSIIDRTAAGYEKEMSVSTNRGGRPDSLKNVVVSFAGYHTLWLEGVEMQKRDMLVTIAITAIGVFFIFIIGFRNIRFLPYAFLPLIVALVWTLGLSTALFGSINIYTFLFTIMIMGLGIDFAIHVLNSYRVTLMTAFTREDAWLKALNACGSAVLCGAATTIAVFALLLLSDFPEMRKLGLLVAAGLTFVLINVFLLMPAIMRFGKFEQRASVVTAKAEEVRSRVGAIVGWSLAHYKKITVMTVLLTAGICFYVFPLTLSPESTEEVSKHSPSATVVERLTESVGVFPQHMLAVSTGRTLSEALETSYSLYNDLKELQKEGFIAQFDTPSRFLPPYDMQRRNLKTLKNTSTLDHATFRKNYKQALDRRRITSGYLRDMYFPLASNILLPNEIVTIDKLAALGYSDNIKRYVHREGVTYELATYIFHSSKAYDQKMQSRALNKLYELPLVREGKVKLVGSPVFTREVRDVLSKSLKRIFIAAGLFILAILFVYFRSVKASLLALTPVLVSVVAMLGVFKLLGYELNAFNSMWLAIILGIGIDDGIHLISRYRSSSDNLVVALGETGRAITMTTLTTLVAFGSMALAEFPGIRSSGVLAGSGMFFALIASLVILPALMKLILRANGNRDAKG